MRVVILCLSWAVCAGGSPLWHPHLSADVAAELQVTLATPPPQLRSETTERLYQTRVQRQTLADAAEIYAPQNQGLVRIAYASFTPDRDPEPGEDLGYGLHVVKRLELPLAGGGIKIIEVNESWPEDKRNGGILNPDDLRIKTLVFQGKRRVAGSHRLYLYDSVRIAWGPAGEIELGRRTRMNGPVPGVMRVPVAAPGSCLQCHSPVASDRYAGDFRTVGVARNYESIVAVEFYNRPVADMKGFRQYLAYLEGAKATPAFRAQVSRELRLPKSATAVPGLYEALLRQSRTGAFNWLADDQGVYPSNSYADLLTRQGHYQVGPDIFVDSQEDTFEGKYRWWEPEPRIPAEGLHYGL